MISEKDITYCLNSFLKNDDCNCNNRVIQQGDNKINLEDKISVIFLLISILILLIYSLIKYIP